MNWPGNKFLTALALVLALASCKKPEEPQTSWPLSYAVMFPRNLAPYGTLTVQYVDLNLQVQEVVLTAASENQGWPSSACQKAFLKQAYTFKKVADILTQEVIVCNITVGEVDQEWRDYVSAASTPLPLSVRFTWTDEEGAATCIDPCLMPFYVYQLGSHTECCSLTLYTYADVAKYRNLAAFLSIRTAAGRIADKEFGMTGL